MTEMRMQPMSSPRSTGIARTKTIQHGKSGIGEHQVTHSSGASAQGALAAGPHVKPRSVTDKGPIPGLSNEQIMLIGGTIEAYRANLVSSAHLAQIAAQAAAQAPTLVQGAPATPANPANPDDADATVVLTDMDQAQVDLAMSILELLGGELDARTAAISAPTQLARNGGGNGGKVNASSGGQVNGSGIGQGRTKIKPATGQTIRR